MMEEKNKFDTFDDLDDFDKMLFDYYDKQCDDVPLSTQLTIENALKNRSSEKSASFSFLKKVAIFIVCLGVVTATTVYAKDIVDFFTNVFTNSNPGIDKAAENGYVQNVDMDFIVCNDVGVKVDYLLMDDHNLDISFVYKYFGEESNIKTIKYNDISIKDEQNNILFKLSDPPIENENNQIIGRTIKSVNKQSVDNSTVRESILITPNNGNFPKSKSIYVKIGTIILERNDTFSKLYGNWNFSINLDTTFPLRNTYNYISNYNKNISLLDAKVSNSSLDIEVQLKIPLDNSVVLNRGSIILRDENNNYYKYSKISSGNNIDVSKSYTSIITLSYPISIYDNINKLYLHIDLNSNNSLDIELEKCLYNN